MAPQRYFIKLAYNGRSYHGWQRQDNATTVQQVLEEAMSTLFGNNIQLTGAGRTDTGVHAREFYAHFDVAGTKDNSYLDDIVYKLNSFLPRDILIFDIFPVESASHARFDALSRTYEYIITTRKDPFLQEFSWHVYGELDLELMNKGAEILKEYKDFTSFSKLHTQVMTNDCNIMQADWEQNDHLIIFTIKADRFLRNMVRAIVGTLVDLGKAKITLEDIRIIIEARNRSEAGLSVPAQGLYLTHVDYPEGILSRRI
ncbi:MAG TPA: tRNA pseudouridine(38-40) synthase TruA [Bacteroidales bacterium]|nr:tRNA pseudouridine(38-40) synthase TruA [Bacteroidales bacterium]